MTLPSSRALPWLREARPLEGSPVQEGPAARPSGHSARRGLAEDGQGRTDPWRTRQRAARPLGVLLPVLLPGAGLAQVGAGQERVARAPRGLAVRTESPGHGGGWKCPGTEPPWTPGREHAGSWGPRLARSDAGRGHSGLLTAAPATGPWRDKLRVGVTPPLPSWRSGLVCSRALFPAGFLRPRGLSHPISNSLAPAARPALPWAWGRLAIDRAKALLSGPDTLAGDPVPFQHPPSAALTLPTGPLTGLGRGRGRSLLWRPLLGHLTPFESLHTCCFGRSKSCSSVRQ